jgi:acyl-CoA hydrolase
MERSKGKPVKESQVDVNHIVLPNEGSARGYVLGGVVMHMVDMTAAIAAHRHSRRLVVTASMDKIDFHHPIKVGHLMILKASVNFVSRTSMEIGVKVFSENILTGEQQHTSTAYLTFVALDDNGKPTPVADLILETDNDKRRFSEAQERRRKRLEVIKAKSA